MLLRRRACDEENYTVNCFVKAAYEWRWGFMVCGYERVEDPIAQPCRLEAAEFGLEFGQSVKVFDLPATGTVE